MRSAFSVALSTAVLLGLQACGATGPCTLVGGIDGINVVVAEDLYVEAGSLQVRVCDGRGCASVTKVIEKGPVGSYQRTRTATFSELGRDFPPGSVTVNARLFDAAGTLRAARDSATTLVRKHPNGEDCAGEYVTGSFSLRAADGV